MVVKETQTLKILLFPLSPPEFLSTDHTKMLNIDQQKVEQASKGKF